MRLRGPIAVFLLLLALLVLASLVSAEGSSLFRLDNERDSPTTVFDIKNASREELSTTKYFIALNSSMVHADVDSDGYPEVFFCTYDGRLVRYNTSNDTYEVVIEDGEAFYTHTPQVVDVDLDGSYEVLLYDPIAPAVHCFDLASGREEWSIANPTDGHGIFPQPKVIVERGTNTSRVLVLMGPGTLVLLDGDGNRLASRDIPLADATSYHVPTMGVADVDMDGSLEVVVSSTKRQGDGGRYVELDVFSLESLDPLRTIGVPGDEERWNYASSPPLIVDLFQSLGGLEIVVGTVYGGVAAFSSEDGSLLWHHRVDGDRNWLSIGTVRTRRGLLVTATSRTGLLVFDSSGTVLHSSEQSIDRFCDVPLVGYFDPGRVGQCLMYCLGGSATAIDPNDDEWFIWRHHEIHYSNGMRFAIIDDRKDVAMELHLFYRHRDDEGDRVVHVRYWIPRAGDANITVDPASWSWYPNVSVGTRGITLDGAPVEFNWIVVRLYQGISTDQVALRRWRKYDKMESMGIYRFWVKNSSFGTDGIDNDHSEVHMGMIASWYYVQFGNVHLHVTAYYTDGTAVSVDVRDWLRPVRGLTTGGRLELEDDEGDLHLDGDWVRAGIDATLRGVRLTFPDGLHFPDAGDIQLVLAVGGAPHPAGLGPYGEITSALRLPAGPTGDVEITLGIANKWTGFRSNHTMTVRLDADPPSFISFFPENGTWVADVNVAVSCLVTDGEGSGVADVQVRYWSPGEGPGDWMDADLGDRPTGTMAVRVLHIEEGNWSVQWRVRDLVGNGPATSPFQSVNVDLTRVIFRGFTPAGWVNSTPVEVSVTVLDVGGSGVDLGSIEYTYSTAGVFDLTGWESAGLSGVREEVRVTLTLAFREGDENVVVMRAADAVGNSRSSTVYTVLVDLTPPTFHDPVPCEDDVVFNTSLVPCVIHVADTGSGVDGVEFRYSVGADGWSAWERAGSQGGDDPLWAADVPKNAGGPTSVQWRARDLAESGTAYSDVCVVNLNRPPEIVRLVPVSGTRVREGEEVAFSVEALDPEGDNVYVVWRLDGEEVSENEAFSTDLSPGVHKVSLALDDGQGNVVGAWIEVYSVERTEFTLGEGWPFLLLLLVLSTAVVVVVYTRRTGNR